MKILLIEDEQPAARQLTRLIHEYDSSFVVVDTLDSVEGAVSWLKTFPAPDLIFMDIQIADGLSFDIFTRISVESPVVFTTAFDQYAVQAFRVNAIDYLLKPIDPVDLAKAIDKIRKQPSSAPSTDLSELIRLFKKDNFKDRFLVKSGNNLGLLQTEDIAYFLSNEGLTQAFTYNGKKYFIEHTLEELETLVNPRDFFRISRNMTVHLKSIVRISPHFNGRLKLELNISSEAEAFVSRNRVGDFKVWLGG
ncbi:MAG TPA: LytTR family DNA-binding domain-containing protein [Flavilitoribacter sp.]|nr:LytTR family DNA-binding domain-containing protein [Flavilitoribacter sp.]HMQ90920.1 LytTR family DNA-binding domain-containing protein [Flavilitoribacter sp.]